MSDLISRSEVWKAFISRVDSICDLEDVRDILDSIPTADNSIALLPNNELLVDTEYTDQVESVRLMNYEGFTRVFDEPKVGRWIHDVHYGLKLPEHRCSICGEWEYSDTESKFCPNCGAKMEESR